MSRAALSQKDGNNKPLYDHEQIIFNSLVAHNGNKYLWIKKAEAGYKALKCVLS